MPPDPVCFISSTRQGIVALDLPFFVKVEPCHLGFGRREDQRGPERLVREGRLREDLYYRLSGMRLQLPPLRERREEIPALVEHYIRKFAQKQKKTGLTLGDEALEYLLYPRPGNLRQLAPPEPWRRRVALADSETTFTPARLSPEIQTARRTVPAVDADGAEVLSR